MPHKPQPAIIENRIKRSIALHRAIIKRLRENPDLWEKPLRNIERWTDKEGRLPGCYYVWKMLLTTMSHEDILKLLLSRSQRATHLRSSSPFVGIIDQETRDRIFRKYRRN